MTSTTAPIRRVALEDFLGVTVVHRRIVGTNRSLCGLTPKSEAPGSNLVCARCQRSERTIDDRLARQVRRLQRDLNRRLGADGEAQLVIDRDDDGQHLTALDVELERAGLVTREREREREVIGA